VEKNKESKEKERDCAATLSDLYPSTCLAWVALTSIKTPASIAIRVTEARNLPHYEKVTAHGGDFLESLSHPKATQRIILVII